MSAMRRGGPGRNERAGGERQQLALARGDGGAEEADPEREVLNDGTGGGNADAEQAANDDLEEREHDHRQHGQVATAFSTSTGSANLRI